jgi:DNA-binding MarR family transcriptional regulator
MSESKAGTFNAYLQYAQRSGSETPSRPSVPASVLGLLTRFPQEQGAPMGELASVSGMSAPSFRDALKKLADSQFIEISGPPLSEIVKLTDKGRDAAALL